MENVKKIAEANIPKFHRNSIKMFDACTINLPRNSKSLFFPDSAGQNTYIT